MFCMSLCCYYVVMSTCSYYKHNNNNDLLKLSCCYVASMNQAYAVVSMLLCHYYMYVMMSASSHYWHNDITTYTSVKQAKESNTGAPIESFVVVTVYLAVRLCFCSSENVFFHCTSKINIHVRVSFQSELWFFHNRVKLEINWTFFLRDGDLYIM